MSHHIQLIGFQRHHIQKTMERSPYKITIQSLTKAGGSREPGTFLWCPKAANIIIYLNVFDSFSLPFCKTIQTAAPSPALPQRDHGVHACACVHITLYKILLFGPIGHFEPDLSEKWWLLWILRKQ